MTPEQPSDEEQDQRAEQRYDRWMPDMVIEVRFRHAGVELRSVGGVLDKGAVWGRTLGDALMTLTRMVQQHEAEEARNRSLAGN